MISTMNVRCKKNGSAGTRYSKRNRPTPTFFIAVPYPPIRASTLATLEEVSTVPETTSPLRTTGVLSDIAKMRGGALAGTRTTWGMTVVGASVATGACGGGAVPALSGEGVAGWGGPAGDVGCAVAEAGDGDALCAGT